nr:hypothetical protein [uncultured Flavobacterium sp.]
MVIKNLGKKLYGNNYPQEATLSIKGFELNEIVLDMSVSPPELAVVLMVFPSGEVRLDTNGVVSESKVEKININSNNSTKNLLKEILKNI